MIFIYIGGVGFPSSAPVFSPLPLSFSLCGLLPFAPPLLLRFHYASPTLSSSSANVVPFSTSYFQVTLLHPLYALSFFFPLSTILLSLVLPFLLLLSCPSVSFIIFFFLLKSYTVVWFFFIFLWSFHSVLYVFFCSLFHCILFVSFPFIHLSLFPLTTSFTNADYYPFHFLHFFFYIHILTHHSFFPVLSSLLPSLSSIRLHLPPHKQNSSTDLFLFFILSLIYDNYFLLTVHWHLLHFKHQSHSEPHKSKP